MSKLTGKLTVTAAAGKNLDSEDVGDQDPFLTLMLKGEKHRTKTHKKGGSKPVWDQTFTFTLNNVKEDELLRVECFDEDVLSNDKIGRTDIPLTYLFSTGLDKKDGQWYQLVHHDNFKRITGYIRLIVKWEGTGHEALVSAPAAQQPPAPSAAELELQKQAAELAAKQAEFYKQQAEAEKKLAEEQAELFRQQQEKEEKEQKAALDLAKELAIQKQLEELAAARAALAEQQRALAQQQRAPFVVVQDVKDEPPAKKKSPWTHIKDDVDTIGIDRNGNIIINDKACKIHERDAKSGKWRDIEGNSSAIARGVDGADWLINKKNWLYYRVGDRWKHIKEGTARQISVGSSRHVVIVNEKDEIFKWNGSGWDQIPGTATTATVSENGDIWISKKGEGIFRLVNKKWVQVAKGDYVQIALLRTGVAYVLDSRKKIYRSDDHGKNWEKVQGTLCYLVGAGDFLAGVNNAGKAYYQRIK